MEVGCLGFSRDSTSGQPGPGKSNITRAANPCNPTMRLLVSHVLTEGLTVCATDILTDYLTH